MYAIHIALKNYYQENRFWVHVIFVVATLNALRNIGVLYAEDKAHDNAIEWDFYIINEFTGSYTVALLIPLLILFFKRFPLVRLPGMHNLQHSLAYRIICYLLATIAFALLHTTLMYTSRLPFYDWVGITRLDEIFNDLPYRYAMEYFKQFLAFSFIYVGYYAVSYHNYYRDAQIHAAKLSEDLAQSRLKALQMQLHPHFFFNTLNTISSILYDRPADADNLISRLSSFLRKVIDIENKPLHSLKKEVEFIREYGEIMSSRYPDRLSITFNIAPGTEDFMIPSLISQPLLENSIKYGMQDAVALHIDFVTHQSGDHLVLEISDDGRGFNEGSLHTGVGLRNVHQRLQLAFGEEAEMELINSETGGSLVRLIIPKI